MHANHCQDRYFTFASGIHSLIKRRDNLVSDLRIKRSDMPGKVQPNSLKMKRLVVDLVS